MIASEGYKFVWQEKEKEAVPEICSKVRQGILDFAFLGPERAMNSLNTRKKD